MHAAWFALARLERGRGRREDASQAIDRALELEPHNADYWYLSGMLAHEQADPARAVSRLERAVAVDPDHAQAHNALGYVLFRDLGEYERGAHHIARALHLDPDDPNYLCNRTMLLIHGGEYESAVQLCDRLLQAGASLPEARLNRALARLTMGDFERGFEDYEARKQVRCNFQPRHLPWPEWQGEETAGKTLFVYGEQGIGDEIMFASCLQELIGRAGHCIVECAPALEKLFARSFPRATVRARETTTHADMADFQVAAGSLPLHLERGRRGFPSHDGYLEADPLRVSYWSQRLEALGPGLKVGISWRGGAVSTRRSLRSTELQAWEPLLRTAGAHFVSLQYGDCEQERALFERHHGIGFAHWQEAVDDFDETAALVGALDLVVSVCTAVVHLAGALGRPVWVLVPTTPEWRYGADSRSMPWYPGSVLLRQRAPGDWGPVIGDAARRLALLAARQ
jgi:Tfp pilus assembly protein PilF